VDPASAFVFKAAGGARLFPCVGGHGKLLPAEDWHDTVELEKTREVPARLATPATMNIKHGFPAWNTLAIGHIHTGKNKVGEMNNPVPRVVARMIRGWRPLHDFIHVVCDLDVS
jgi:hypothetical protein